jgi:hypothetical protein
MTKTKTPTPGDSIHFLVDGFTFALDTGLMAQSHVSRRGETAVLTQKLIDASRDRDGHSWLDLLHDELAQIERWGQVRFAPGAAPADIAPWLPGSVEAEQAREQARRAAFAILDDTERRRALADIDARFGRPSTSRTLNSAPQRDLTTHGENRGR